MVTYWRSGSMDPEQSNFKVQSMYRMDSLEIYTDMTCLIVPLDFGILVDNPGFLSLSRRYALSECFSSFYWFSSRQKLLRCVNLILCGQVHRLLLCKPAQW